MPKYIFSFFAALKLGDWANRSSCMKAVDYNQSLKTIKFAASSRWACRCRSHCSFSWGDSFLVSNATGVIVSIRRMCVYLLKSSFDYDSRSAKLFAEKVAGLIMCLWAETQSRNWSFRLTSEAILEILHFLSITQSLLMNNDIEEFCPIGPLQRVSWKLR